MNKKQKDTGVITLSREIKNEFRKFCLIQDLRPNEVIVEILSEWVKQQKKKIKITIPKVTTTPPTTSANP